VRVRADRAHDPVGAAVLQLRRAARGVEQRPRGSGQLGRAGEQRAARVEDDRRAHVGRQLVHVFECQGGGQGRRHRRAAEYGRVPLNRIAWLTTVGICLIISLILLISGYLGYAGVLLAIAIAAGINLT
jgi:hypothetical protein